LKVFYASCTFPDDFWVLHALNISLPWISLGVLFASAWISVQIFQRKDPKFMESKLKPNPYERAIFLYSSGLSSMYTFICSIGLAPFRCYEQDDGSQTLVPAPSLDCFDSRWKENWFLVLLGLSYVIFIPLYFFWILWMYKQNEYSNTFHFQYGFIVRGLKKKFYWWNLFQMLRKAVVVMLVDLTSTYNVYLRTFLVIMTLLFGMFVETILQPREETGIATFVAVMYVFIAVIS
jgi:hypothetical protein